MRNKKVPAVGIKELDEYNIERAWQLMEAKAKEFYKEEFQAFDLVMISKRSTWYREWIAVRNKKLNKDDSFPDIDDIQGDTPPINAARRGQRNNNPQINCGGIKESGKKEVFLSSADYKTDPQ